jgi:hypothetical protein
MTLSAWSYSRFALYEQCPFKFDQEVNKGNKQPPGKAMERGNEIHQGIAAYIIGNADAPPKDAVAKPFPRKLIEEARAYPDKLVEQQWGFTRRWQPTGWFGKETWFRCVLDFAVLYEDMHADIVDWKTGKKYGTAADQMELNAVALFCQFRPAVSATSRMVYLDEGSEDTEDYSRSDLQKLVQKWEDKVAPMFADTTFLPRPNDKCKFCHVSRSAGGPCRFG